MNPVSVERQRRVAKQQHIIRLYRSRPRRAIGRARRSRRLLTALRHAAIDDVVLIDDCQPARAGNRVANANEHEWPRTAFFCGDTIDRRRTLDRFANTERLVELYAAPSPHATWQWHGWQKTAALRVAIGADFRLSSQWQEIQPVPQWRQRIP